MDHIFRYALQHSGLPLLDGVLAAVRQTSANPAAALGLTDVGHKRIAQPRSGWRPGSARTWWCWTATSGSTGAAARAVDHRAGRWRHSRGLRGS
ncbi:MAG TPA: hypothetical protein VES60_10305 [Nakamurella sp.]|nr:hypothetical protein [Nakamurella sp.]